MTPQVLGIDLSLSATGVAHPDGTATTLTPPNGHTGMRRLDWIVCAVLFAVPPRPAVVAVEGYAYARHNQAHQLGELGGVVRLALYRQRLPFVDVAPSALKKYATGSGRAGKDEVLVAAVRRLGYEGHDNNQADALFLRAMLLDALGSPVVDMPAANRQALTKLDVDGLL